MYVLTKDYKVIQPWELGGIDYIKYASTIEELCDLFVTIKEDHIKVEGTRYLEGLRKLVNKGHIVYGATWTDKGLIYVAKLNKDGELDLI